MTPVEKQRLRDQLEREIKECDETLERLKEAGRAVSPDNAIGRLTRMEMIGDQNVSKAKLNQLEERRYKLRQARGKIDQPGFGTCARCGRPIPVERLMAIPESTLCVACASGH